MYYRIGIAQYFQELYNKQVNVALSKIVDYWGDRMPEEEKRAHFYFLSISRLLKRFENGEYHVAHKHWTGNAISDSILAEQHIIMYADEENGDVLDMSRIESGKVKIEEKRSICQI